MVITEARGDERTMRCGSVPAAFCDAFKSPWGAVSPAEAVGGNRGGPGTSQV